MRCVPSGCVCSAIRNKTQRAENRRRLLVSAGLRMSGYTRCHDTGLWKLPGAYFRRAAHVWAYMRSATFWSCGGLSCVPGSRRRHGASSPCPTTPTHGRSVDWTCGRIRRMPEPVSELPAQGAGIQCDSVSYEMISHRNGWNSAILDNRRWSRYRENSPDSNIRG